MVVDRISISADHLGDLVVLDHVEVVADKGLVGDRHFGNKARHVSIQSREELAVASERLGRQISADATRRNITISAGLLPRIRGQRIVVGSSVLEVFADAAPCELMEQLSGPGARAALKRLAGIHCRVISSGQISVGDILRPGNDL